MEKDQRQRERSCARRVFFFGGASGIGDGGGVSAVAIFFLVAMHLMFHFVESFIERDAGIFAFDVSHDGVVALDLR